VAARIIVLCCFFSGAFQLACHEGVPAAYRSVVGCMDDRARCIQPPCTSRSTVATCESSSPHRTTTVVVVGIVSFFSVVVLLFVCLLRVDLTRVHSQTSTGNIFYFVTLIVLYFVMKVSRSQTHLQPIPQPAQ
jgi:hypothetical protein